MVCPLPPGLFQDRDRGIFLSSGGNYSQRPFKALSCHEFVV